MKVDYSQSPTLFAFANERTGGGFAREKGHRILTLIGRDGIAAQAVFTGVVPGSKAEISVWADQQKRGLAGRAFIRAIFDAGFRRWECRRLHAVTSESNVAAQQALIAMGFRFEAPLKCWFGDEEGWMFRMLREECAWLKKE